MRPPCIDDRSQHSQEVTSANIGLGTIERPVERLLVSPQVVKQRNGGLSCNAMQSYLADDAVER